MTSVVAKLTIVYVSLIDDVGLFNIALTEVDIKNIMTDGLVKTLGLTAVEASAKLSTTWARIKTQEKL